MDNEIAYGTQNPDFAKEIASLSRTQSRKLFPSEYTSWRNMKPRASQRGGVVHPPFQDWPSFLYFMGPSDGRTLDRIDFNNPDYGPGLCRWATKSEQANNRTTTIFLKTKEGPKALSLVAKDLGISPSTIRSRLSRGASDAEAVMHQPERGFAGDAYCDNLWRDLWPENYKTRLWWERRFDMRSERHLNRAQFFIKVSSEKLNQLRAALYEPYTDDLHEELKNRDDEIRVEIELIAPLLRKVSNLESRSVKEMKKLHKRKQADNFLGCF